MREQIIGILKSIRPDVEFEGLDSLFTSGTLSSMNTLMLVTKLEEVFDVEVPVNKIRTENFDTIDAIENFVKMLQDED